MSWSDLDKLGVAKPRPDGGPTLVAIDDRSISDIIDTRLVSTLAAMSKVARAKDVLAERYAGKGVVAYVTQGPPPAWFISAVASAGGIVFDGTREHALPAPKAATLVLDETLCDLAIAVRRRLKVRTFLGALELREAELRRTPIAIDKPLAYWSAVYELMALTGEILRADHPGRYVITDKARVPIALDMGKQRRVLLGRVAEAITGGEDVSMKTFVATTAAWFAPPPPRVPDRNVDTGPLVPRLIAREHLDEAQMTWEPLVPPEHDTRWMPVIGYAHDRGETLQWGKLGAIDDAFRARARHSLDTAALSIETADVGGFQLVAVLGEAATEALLHPPTMHKLVLEIGNETMILGIPARGQLFAIDAAASTDVRQSFHMMMERLHLEAPERERLSSELVIYKDKPVGRVDWGFMEARRLLRLVGQDPDALGDK